MTTLRLLAQRKKEGFFTRHGLKNFLRQYQQLSGIVLRQPRDQVVWLNSLAKHKVPPEIVETVQHLGE